MWRLYSTYQGSILRNLPQSSVSSQQGRFSTHHCDSYEGHNSALRWFQTKKSPKNQSTGQFEVRKLTFVFANCAILDAWQTSTGPLGIPGKIQCENRSHYGSVKMVPVGSGACVAFLTYCWLPIVYSATVVSCVKLCRNTLNVV